jgi:hypothetical protein
MYPPSSPGTLGNRGSAMLAEALIGYLPGSQDGAGPDLGDGAYGFRTKKVNAAMGGASGRVYGPYANTDPKVFNGTAFVDPWGHEILYYRSTKAQSSTTMNLVTSIFGTAASDDLATCFFLVSDNQTVTGVPTGAPSPTAMPPTLAVFFNNLGGSTTTANKVAGPVTGSTSYILISAGPDETYFTADDIVMSK